jgi:AcrR family transcriptional regulator
VGLGTTALYYYFKNKMDLFKAVSEREGADILTALEAAVERETDPGRRLRAFCLIRFKLLAEKYEVLQISERVHRELLELSQKIQVSVHQSEGALLEKIIHQGIQTGLFKKVDVPLLAAFIQQTFRYLDAPWGYFSGRKELEKRVDFALDILLHGLEARA